MSLSKHNKTSYHNIFVVIVFIYSEGANDNNVQGEISHNVV